MDRPTTRSDADDRGSRAAPGGGFVLPSRRPAFEACREALAAGPVLLTGEAGVGKTWLWRRIGVESPPSRRWLGVDLTPSDGPADFYRLIGHRLGLVAPDPTPSRLELLDDLAERHVDGERPTLVVEEAHNLSTAVWEEVRVLANRLGEPGGFAGLLLVGQTPLARRFGTRPFAGLEARLASKVHLGPIDADEAMLLLTRLHPGRSWTIEEVEALHRDAAGNPGRLLRGAGPTPGPRPSIRPTPRPALSQVRQPPITPTLGQPRPPLIVEDHLIEVGWSPEDEPPVDVAEESGAIPPGAMTGEGEEEVRDHYAALQAWREWEENQARRSPSLAETTSTTPADEGPDEETVKPGSPLADRPTVRAEGEQRFAPFGQLFSKLAQAHDPD